MRLIASILGIGALVVAAILVGGRLSGFLDIPSALLVGGVAALGTGGVHGYRVAIDAVRAAVQPATAVDRPQAIRVLGTARSAVWAGGCIGVLVGIVQMLQTLADPAAVGPALAVTLLTLFYAAVGSELVLAPLQQRLVELEHAASDGTPSALLAQLRRPVAATPPALPRQTLLLIGLTAASTAAFTFVMAALFV